MLFPKRTKRKAIPHQFSKFYIVASANRSVAGGGAGSKKNNLWIFLAGSERFVVYLFLF